MRNPIHALVPLALALALSLAACAQPAASRQPVAAPAASQAPPAAGNELQVQVVASGLEHPWAVAPLPDGRFLVTERPGRLRLIGTDGTISAPLAGTPAVFAKGQGGLLDVVLDPDFAGNRRIWLSYAEPGDGGTAGTALATATLGDAGLTDLKVLYRQEPKLDGGQHFGSRVAFDTIAGKTGGHVFVSQGDRGQRPSAQDLSMLQGKLVRLNMDGSVPADNPFVGRSGVRPEIFSYGHRNMQGMATDPRTGTLWQSEHGPRGGDEINLPQPGRNYGWPVITHGINYSGLKIPEAEGKAKAGMEPPYHVWEKSPALSGMAFYVGHPQSAWNDSLLLGALVQRSLIRLSLQGDRIVAEERLLEDLGKRIRDVRVAADGMVYVLTDEGDGQLLRLVPPKAR
ncbi:hydrophobic compound transporter HcuB [Thermomonas brevis]